MRKVIPAILLLFFFVKLLNSQIIDKRIQIVKNDGINVVCKFQIAIDKDSIAMGNAVSRLNFHPWSFSFPERPKVIKDFMFYNFENSSYKSSVSQPIRGTISINIVYGGSAPIFLTKEFIDIVLFNLKSNSLLRDTIFTQGLQQFFLPSSSDILDVGSLSISAISEEFIPEPTLPLQDAVFASKNVILKWRDVPRAELFQVEVSTDPSFRQTEQFIDEINETEVKVKDLKNGTRYYWRVRSVVAEQVSHYSRTKSFVITIPPPSDLSFSSSANNGFVQLNWTNNTSLANSIIIERKSGDSNNDFEVIDTIDAKSTTYLDALIDKAKTYVYRVRAINKIVSSPSSDSVDISVHEKVISSENNLPIEFKLEQNYPNPFNPLTVIKYSVKEDSYIKITIYSFIGEKVIDLVDKPQNAGSYKVVWDISSASRKLSSGVYIYTMTAKSSATNIIFQNVKKMVLLK